MEISKGRIKQIADTLPIGYYANRRVAINFSEQDETSSYNLETDEITFAYNNITEALSHIEADDEEKYIRATLYHELSHAMISPKNLFHYCSYFRINSDIVNIFEDERIETILKNAFLNVNFKENLQAITNYKGEAPTNALEAFFQVVRFRKGKQEWLKEVERIINERRSLTDCDTYYYVCEINDLYNTISKEFSDCEEKNNFEIFQQQMDIVAQGEANANIDINQDNNDTAPNEGLEIIRNAFQPSQLSTIVNKLEPIFTNFNKKNSSGSGLTSYSGKLNPRLCNDNNYKFFERKSEVRGNNKYGSFHLNLFIDVSGSYIPNREITNCLLKSLALIEKKSPNFSFDVVHCSCGERLKEKGDRFINPCGGNRLDSNIFQIYKKLQKSNTYNYNIFLFDGDAYPMKVRSRNTFQLVDFNNCCFISDFNNERYLKKMKNAKIIYTNNYAETFIQNVILALQKAFR